MITTAVDIYTDDLYTIKALDKRQHPNVVSLIKIIGSDDCSFIGTELCPEGHLFDNIVVKKIYVGIESLPENCLVTDQGITVKHMDFGLATTNTCSSDFGRASYFYIFPEGSFYESAPSDDWSLGVILDPYFLKTILPLSDEVIPALNRIFECDPNKRITIPELRTLVLECPSFTVPSEGSWNKEEPVIVESQTGSEILVQRNATPPTLIFSSRRTLTSKVYINSWSRWLDNGGHAVAVAGILVEIAPNCTAHSPMQNTSSTLLRSPVLWWTILEDIWK
ncbi:kinase-like domain-containing protein [Aspergillus alliaceus]|uniref:kinase-like domain-containing protein n=1 Tax=Petromyces alliaceus TaxID=209559 RepID=UPI0012A5A44C|nr:kinase-like domain-containing protein [Aspergillus alliaceus]KAB8236294.1 kinase-like domain-containing protein [Aspergillus alliaceus]